MTKINDKIFAEAEVFVKEFLEGNAPDELLFHNFTHTQNVLKYAETIGQESKLNDHDLNVVRIAALFHDVGYINSFEQHENEGVKIVEDYLKARDIDQNDIDKVQACILATKLPQSPKSLLEKVICDADFMHLAAEDYTEQMEMLRLEINSIEKGKLSKKLFDIESLKMFNKHYYHTEYGQTVLQPLKEIRYQKIIDKMLARERRKSMLLPEAANYSRGVETMFRTTSRTQINLNSIADNKSTILISINAIIISVIITFLASNSLEMKNIIIPITICLASALSTIILAILATRPQLRWGRFTMDEVYDNKIDLLFFGNFYNMKFEEYKNAIEAMLSDNNTIYGSMIKNQHELGKILAKKFKLLKMAYNVFMVGFSATVVSFLIIFVMA
ncbi:MAG: hypothetical protein CL663_07010 [Bacteroidetes bacterium]|nr:hypothetical protein [Bacteroidota bacterium]